MKRISGQIESTRDQRRRRIIKWGIKADPVEMRLPEDGGVREEDVRRQRDLLDQHRRLLAALLVRQHAAQLFQRGGRRTVVPLLHREVKVRQRAADVPTDLGGRAPRELTKKKKRERDTGSTGLKIKTESPKYHRIGRNLERQLQAGSHLRLPAVGAYDKDDQALDVRNEQRQNAAGEALGDRVVQEKLPARRIA